MVGWLGWGRVWRVYFIYIMDNGVLRGFLGFKFWCLRMDRGVCMVEFNFFFVGVNLEFCLLFWKF